MQKERPMYPVDAGLRSWRFVFEFWNYETLDVDVYAEGFIAAFFDALGYVHLKYPGLRDEEIMTIRHVFLQLNGKEI